MWLHALTFWLPLAASQCSLLLSFIVLDGFSNIDRWYVRDGFPDLSLGSCSLITSSTSVLVHQGLPSTGSYHFSSLATCDTVCSPTHNFLPYAGLWEHTFECAPCPLYYFDIEANCDGLLFSLFLLYYSLLLSCTAPSFWCLLLCTNGSSTSFCSI